MMERWLVSAEERRELRRQAKHWPKERRLAIARFTVETIDECPRCGRPVRRNDPRATADVYWEGPLGEQVKRFRLGHLLCVTGRGPEPPRNLEPL
jgi:hypothetical protein